MSIIFWVSLIWIVYTYVGYLGILILTCRFRKKTKFIDTSYLPSISLVIAAYNEEKVIKRKIDESLNLDYPNDKLEIIIASDCSDDHTDEIVKSYAGQGVILVRNPLRSGKTATQNLAVRQAKGEILVFSDATTVYGQDTLKKLVIPLLDFKVGCVGGEERFLDPENGRITKEVSLFWKYEQFLRQKESEFNTLIGVSGCIFAIRKELYRPLDETLIEDFALPLELASSGYKVVYAKEAIGYEEAVIDTWQEFARKTRIVSGGINVLWKKRYLLNPFKFPVLSFQLISHKIFRWAAPLFFITLFFSNLFLVKKANAYLFFLFFQVSTYLAAIGGYLLRNTKFTPKICKIAYHFFLVNLAGIFGIIKFLRGERKVIWQPIR